MNLYQSGQTQMLRLYELVVELGKAGRFSAVIGTILRDQHAVPDARKGLGKRISVVLSENGISGSYPEDMMNLMRKAVGIIDHLGSEPQRHPQQEITRTN